MSGKNNQVKTEKSLNKPEKSGKNSQTIQFFLSLRLARHHPGKATCSTGECGSGCALPGWDMNPECLQLCRFSLDQYHQFLLH